MSFQDTTYKDKSKKFDIYNDMSDFGKDICIKNDTPDDGNKIIANLKNKNGHFMLFQTLFVLSFVHMDKLPYHIEGILGLGILYMTSRLNRFKKASGNIYMFALSILSLLGCTFSDINHEVKMIETFLSIIILSIEQTSYFNNNNKWMKKSLDVINQESSHLLKSLIIIIFGLLGGSIFCFSHIVGIH